MIQEINKTLSHIESLLMDGEELSEARKTITMGKVRAALKKEHFRQHGREEIRSADVHELMSIRETKVYAYAGNKAGSVFRVTYYTWDPKAYWDSEDFDSLKDAVKFANSKVEWLNKMDAEERGVDEALEESEKSDWIKFMNGGLRAIKGMTKSDAAMSEDWYDDKGDNPFGGFVVIVDLPGNPLSVSFKFDGDYAILKTGLGEPSSRGFWRTRWELDGFDGDFNALDSRRIFSSIKRDLRPKGVSEEIGDKVIFDKEGRNEWDIMRGDEFLGTLTRGFPQRFSGTHGYVSNTGAKPYWTVVWLRSFDGPKFKIPHGADARTAKRLTVEVLRDWDA